MKSSVPLALVFSLAISFSLLAPAGTSAQERLCDPSFENCYWPLLDLVRAETTQIDIAFYMIELPGLADEIIARYKAGVPVRLIAGSDDRIVNTEQHTARLHEELGTSTFRRVLGCGHMVHHAAPELVMAAIAAIGIARREEQASCPPVGVTAPRRHWLHIGESPVAA